MTVNDINSKMIRDYFTIMSEYTKDHYGVTLLEKSNFYDDLIALITTITEGNNDANDTILHLVAKHVSLEIPNEEHIKIMKLLIQHGSSQLRTACIYKIRQRFDDPNFVSWGVTKRIARDALKCLHQCIDRAVRLNDKSFTLRIRPLLLRDELLKGVIMIDPEGYQFIYRHILSLNEGYTKLRDWCIKQLSFYDDTALAIQIEEIVMKSVNRNAPISFPMHLYAGVAQTRAGFDLIAPKLEKIVQFLFDSWNSSCLQTRAYMWIIFQVAAVNPTAFDFLLKKEQFQEVLDMKINIIDFLIYLSIIHPSFSLQGLIRYGLGIFSRSAHTKEYLENKGVTTTSIGYTSLTVLRHKLIKMKCTMPVMNRDDENYNEELHFELAASSIDMYKNVSLNEYQTETRLKLNEALLAEIASLRRSSDANERKERIEEKKEHFQSLKRTYPARFKDPLLFVRVLIHIAQFRYAKPYRISIFRLFDGCVLTKEEWDLIIDQDMDLDYTESTSMPTTPKLPKRTSLTVPLHG
eukprot:CAMPEP_0117432312 /NCGR_PEP_ID=MMETSP0758-20121206/11815_1 /TAXON_ID=63605 /ORGANISM="Percolomonas cosmopolitus, Strain AE-1 (ATCC 50343)" /LENGTH=520 /DNA_ID=CAMNT_0005222133 /DNA_START=238 /DNA_END=1797 /DNA_ORIENTATION=-